MYGQTVATTMFSGRLERLGRDGSIAFGSALQAMRIVRSLLKGSVTFQDRLLFILPGYALLVIARCPKRTSEPRRQFRNLSCDTAITSDIRPWCL